MKHIECCPICEARALQLDAKIALSRPYYNHDGDLGFASAAMVSYALCLRCGAYIQNPRMTDDDIHRYYSSGLYRQWLNKEQSQLDADELRRAKLDASIIKDCIGIVDSHLDVGASRGYLLEEVGARATLAVEPYENYVTAKVDLKYADLSQITHLYNSFGLVTSIHSLEHTLDPMNTLRELSFFVQGAGHLVVEVPSDRSPGGWARLAHTFHFPPWTLHYMAEKVGMKITHMMFTPHLFTIMERK